jgi:hypothetical protein
VIDAKAGIHFEFKAASLGLLPYFFPFLRPNADAI